MTSNDRCGGWCAHSGGVPAHAHAAASISAAAKTSTSGAIAPSSSSPPDTPISAFAPRYHCTQHNGPHRYTAPSHAADRNPHKFASICTMMPLGDLPRMHTCPVWSSPIDCGSQRAMSREEKHVGPFSSATNAAHVVEAYPTHAPHAHGHSAENLVLNEAPARGQPRRVDQLNAVLRAVGHLEREHVLDAGHHL